MPLILKNNLLFTTITIDYQGKSLTVNKILIDTGSTTTLLAADQVKEINIVPSLSDKLRVIRGVGGREVVFSRVLEALRLDDYQLESFEVEIGEMDYGFDLNGILGMNFLVQAGAIIDLKHLSIHFNHGPALKSNSLDLNTIDVNESHTV